MTHINLRRDATDLAVILLGIALYSIGFCVFTLPHNVVIGGMAGFSTLVFHASGERIPVALTMYAMNILLLILGFRALGKAFVARTIFGATAMSLIIGLMEGYFTTHPALVSDTPISIAMGAVLMGLGIGLYYSHHGTCGGTDIVAAILSQRSSMSMGRVMMIVDITIVALSFLLPFDGNLQARVHVRTETIIYGWISICVYSLIADRYLMQGRQTMQFFIISDHWEKIAYRITHETGRGITTWDAKGYWTDTPRTMIMLWCRQSDIISVINIVNEEDPNAYLTQSMVRSIYGNGFDHLTRIKKRLSHK